MLLSRAFFQRRVEKMLSYFFAPERFSEAKFSNCFQLARSDLASVSVHRQMMIVAKLNNGEMQRVSMLLTS